MSGLTDRGHISMLYNLVLCLIIMACFKVGVYSVFIF